MREAVRHYLARRRRHDHRALELGRRAGLGDRPAVGLRRLEGRGAQRRRRRSPATIAKDGILAYVVAPGIVGRRCPNLGRRPRTGSTRSTQLSRWARWCPPEEVADADRVPGERAQQASERGDDRRQRCHVHPLSARAARSSSAARSGIGRAIARALAARGDDVVVADLDESAGVELRRRASKRRARGTLRRARRHRRRARAHGRRRRGRRDARSAPSSRAPASRSRGRSPTSSRRSTTV